MEGRERGELNRDWGGGGGGDLHYVPGKGGLGGVIRGGC